MTKQAIRFELFGSLKMIINESNYNLEELLGKQLSNVFGLLIYNKGKVVSKESLINNFWEDSNNPSSALKYSIFRLRTELNKILNSENFELIATTKTGYMISDEFNITVDCIDMEKIISDAKATRNFDTYELARELYVDKFLANLDSNWVLLARDYFERIYIMVVSHLCNDYFDSKNYDKIIVICEKVLSFDELNEDLTFAYIRALISDKKYNKAINYYNYITKKLHDELNIQIAKKISDLFSGVEVDSNNPKITINFFKDEVDSTLRIAGPLYCDYISFKKIYQIEMRNNMRDGKNNFLIILDLKYSEETDKYIDTLEEIVKKTLRINDVYTRVNSNQIILLVDLSNPNDEYIVVDRIQEKYYKKIDSKKCRLNYTVRSLKDIQTTMNLRSI